MNGLEVTWWRATQVWWSIAWRSVFYIIIICLPAGIVTGVVGAALGLQEELSRSANVIGALLGIPIGVLVIKIVLEKQFREFRILLVPSDRAILEAKPDT